MMASIHPYERPHDDDEGFSGGDPKYVVIYLLKFTHEGKWIHHKDCSYCYTFDEAVMELLHRLDV